MIRAGLLTLAATCVLAGWLPGLAQAQHFHLELGSFNHGHHHHGWHYDHCWHDYHYPRYVYAYPPPVIRERVTYVERPPSVARVEPPAVETLITVQNAAGKSVPVTFLMDAQDVLLRDGELRAFTGRTSRVVEFDRGGDFGSARYDLSAGDYEFVITAQGWDLLRKSSAAASTATKPSVRKNSLPTGTTTR